jgi:hypothetical protein
VLQHDLQDGAATSGRRRFARTRFWSTKKIVTVPPITLKVSGPSPLSIGVPNTFRTSAREVFKGSIPRQEPACAVAVKREQREERYAPHELELLKAHFISASVKQDYVFANGRTRSADSFKSASPGCSCRPFS